MATFSSTGADDLILSLEEVANLPDSVKDDILNAQADVVVKAQKAKARSYGVNKTGVLISSITKGKPKTSKGVRTLAVYPRGTRKRGDKTVRNAEIAFVAEFGRRKQKARPFIRDANEESAAETTAAGAAVYDKFLKSKNL